MTQQAKVISVSGQTAKVIVMRRSACEGCKQKSVCHGESCAEGKPIEAIACNSIGAKAGDMVELTTSSSVILGVSFCVFVLPIVLALCAYLATNSFYSEASLLVALCAFVLSCLFFVFFFNKKFKNKNYVVITKILGEETI